MEYLGLTSTTDAIQTYINPLIERGLVRMTEPDKPKRKRQKFISTRKQKQAGGL